jgi:hypothetical protein
MAKQTLEENSLLPESAKDGLIKDILLDLVLLEDEAIESTESPSDLLQLVTSIVKKYLVINTEEESFRLLCRDICYSAIIFRTSAIPKENSILAKAFVKKAKDPNALAITKLVHHKSTLAFRVPAVDMENKGLTENLGFVLAVINDCLGCDSRSLKIQRDETLGREFTLSTKIQSGLNILLASLSLPNVGGAVTEFATGLKANLPELLAALKVARRNSNLVYKSLKATKAKVAVVSAELLRETINMIFGFKDRGADPFLCGLVKEFLNEMTKPSSNNLPGSYMNQLKARNNAKTDQALLHLMGYTPCSPGGNKVLNTLLHKTKEVTSIKAPKAKKGTTVIGKGVETTELDIYSLNSSKDSEELTFREFRAGVICTLPYIDPKSEKTIKEQLNNQSLSVKELPTLAFWKKNTELAEAVYTAASILTAATKKTGKAKPIHFQESRDRLINLTANQPFVDAKGTRYPKYSDLPSSTRGWFESTYFHKTKVGSAISVRTEKVPKEGEVKASPSEPIPSSTEKAKESTVPLETETKRVDLALPLLTTTSSVDIGEDDMGSNPDLDRDLKEEKEEEDLHLYVTTGVYTPGSFMPTQENIISWMTQKFGLTDSKFLPESAILRENARIDDLHKKYIESKN